jgi:hypothetical protein
MVPSPGESGRTADQHQCITELPPVRTSSTILILFLLANFHHCSNPFGGGRPYLLLYSDTACGKVSDCLLSAGDKPAEVTYLSSNFAHLAWPSSINR